jgi:GntR family transcriptional regulator
MQALPRYQHIINYYRTPLNRANSLKVASSYRRGNVRPFQRSRITIRRALDGLMQEVTFTNKQGKGSFVTTKRTDIQLNHLQGFNQEMRALGFDPSTKLIRWSLSLHLNCGCIACNLKYAKGICYHQVAMC